MLKSLKLINFQCHEKIEIEFDPFITIIIGESNRGKSAILRALKWVCENEPSGLEFLRHGSERVSTILHFDDHKLIRRRSERENTYSLDGQKFVAFGQTVPDPVQDALNLSDVSFQSQLEGPFWFSLSPPQVSRELNRVINLDVIDSCQAEIASEVRKSRTVVEVSQDRLREAEQERDRLQFVQQMNEEVSEIEQIDKEVSEIEQILAENERRIETVDRIKEKQDRSSLLLSDAFSSIGELEALSDRISTLDETIEKCSKLMKEVNKSRERREQLQTEEKRLHVELDKLMVGECPLCGQEIGNGSRRD